MPDSRLTIGQMSAEFLRELGVLLVAFGPLDYLFAERSALTIVTIGGIVGLGGVFFSVGVLIERKRRL